MNVGKLLAELRNNLLRDKSDAVAGASDLFWDDDTLLLYLDDAQTQFASLTHCLRDSTTPAITQIALEAGVSRYTLDRRVLAVLSARLQSQNAPLAKATFDGVHGSQIDSTGAGLRVEAAKDAEPRWFYVDEAEYTLILHPAPSVDFGTDTLQLRVSRLPLRTLDATNLNAEPEIPSQYHLDLVEWAAYRALRNHDAETESMSKAERHRVRFMDAVNEGRKHARRATASPIQFNFGPRW